MAGRISRRSAAALIGASPALPFSVYGNRQATAFALAGDRWHNIDYIRVALGKTLGRDLGISIDFTDD